jgi:hypothetical protein
MKKLDDIPKKHPFNVPDDYFDQLPGRILARVQGQGSQAAPAMVGFMRYALAMLVVAAVAFVWLWSGPGKAGNESPEAILSSLETSDLVAYLNEGDITTEELLDDVQFSNDDASEIEEAVFSLELNDSDLNAFMNEID